MTIDIKKAHLIRQISETKDEVLLSKLEEVVESSGMSQNILGQLSSPVEKHFDLKAIKKAQNFKPVDKEEINRLIEEANIQEPIEKLLEMI